MPEDGSMMADLAKATTRGPIDWLPGGRALMGIVTFYSITSQRSLIPLVTGREAVYDATSVPSFHALVCTLNLLL